MLVHKLLLCIWQLEKLLEQAESDCEPRDNYEF